VTNRSELVGRALSSLRLRAADAADAVLRRTDERLPPRRLQNLAGNSDFRATGEEFGRHLTELAALSASDRVLDIGCGAGRIARVLARDLRPPGSYDGFDVVPEAIAWCRRHYRDTRVQFRFVHADLGNTMYNPAGAASAAEYRFPYPDGAFDLVIATSVFTHLVTDAADHYLSEAARVLATGGRLFTTWFLIGGERPAGTARPTIDFTGGGGPAAVLDTSLPEAGVAYDATWVSGRLAARGLRLCQIAWGTWSGGDGRSSQDIVLADSP
jgi:SAM-dependent methyltransferase